jgi:3-oxoacyl-[acyl-carrier-protein] synthase II
VTRARQGRRGTAPDGIARRVVITGVGIVSAAGIGLDDTWRQLASAPPRPLLFTGPPPTDDVQFSAFAAAEYDLCDLPIDARRRGWLCHDEVREARDLRHLVAATALALADARLPPDCEPLDPPVSVVVANESPGFDELSQVLFTLASQPGAPATPMAQYTRLADRFFQLNTFLPPHYLARTFGLAGLGLFVNSACASGLNAIDVAAGAVRSGRSDVAVAAASDNALSVAKFLWFRDLGLYALDGVLRPYDARQTGTVFGDGGAALILEDAGSAAARGARVYAEYAGAGFAQDGWKITVPAAAKNRGDAALRRAIAEAGAEPSEIDLVVPHGIGSPASDQYEARLLHGVFGSGDKWPAVTALKPSIGHSLGASALMETALLLGAMDRKAVPPTPAPELPFTRHPVPLVTEWRALRADLAVKLTCAFGGYYGAMVLRRFEPADR